MNMHDITHTNINLQSSSQNKGGNNLIYFEMKEIFKLLLPHPLCILDTVTITLVTKDNLEGALEKSHSGVQDRPTEAAGQLSQLENSQQF